MVAMVTVVAFSARAVLMQNKYLSTDHHYCHYCGYWVCCV
jgi:hypothetical protein